MTDEDEPADRQGGSDADEPTHPASDNEGDDEFPEEPSERPEAEEADESPLEDGEDEELDTPEDDDELVEEIESRIEEADEEKTPEAAEPVDEQPEPEPTDAEPSQPEAASPEAGVDEAPTEPVDEPELEEARTSSVEDGGAPPPPDAGEDLDDLEDVDVETIDAENVQPYTEPGGAGSSGDGPATPSASSLSVVEEVSPVEIEAVEGVGEPRRAPHASELTDALGIELDEPITPVPPVGPDVEVVDLSAIREGITYVRLLFDDEASRHLYQVIEPPLDEAESQTLDFIRETLVQTLSVRDPESDIDWRAYLRQAVHDVIREHGLEVAPVTLARVHYYLERDFLGYGPIDVMMQDPLIEDISCDGPGIPLYVFHRELESTRTNVTFDDEQALDSYVRSLAQRSGRHISIAEPLLDATLPDTSRLQATLSQEVTTRGSSFTIRRFRADPLTAPDLVRLGTMSARMAAWIWMAMEAGAPMLVAGGTASGKTTTLSAMTQFIPPAKKVVTIEDTREFSLVHENWVASLTRSGGFGKSEDREIDMYKLLRTSLRQRPEYIIVGEVRGEEAQTLFQAMATGHATYSTMHADSVRSAVYRLENRPIDIPRMMLQTLDAVIVQGQTRIGDRLVRRILDVTEIVGIDDSTGDVLTNQVYEWRPDGDEFRFRGRSNILEELRLRRNTTVDEIETDWQRRTRVMEWMVDEGIRHITDVAHVIGAYYAGPQRLVDRIEAGAGEDAVPDAGELEPAGDELAGREGEQA